MSATTELPERPCIDILARKSKVLTKGDRLREVSTDEQIKQGRAWADRNGYRVRHIWVELGSAYNAARERKTFEKALAALMDEEADALWVYMLDRFSRKGAEDVLRVIGKARVIFDYDRLDSMDERDRGRIIDEAERARSYSVRLSHRLTDVKTTQRDAGEWLGNLPPWGLVVDRKTRKVSPDHTPAGGTLGMTRAQVVAKVVADLAAHVTPMALIRWLNDAGVPSPRGARWHRTVLLGVVLSPAMAGLQVRMAGNKTVPYRNERGEMVSIGTGPVTWEQIQAATRALHGRTSTRTSGRSTSASVALLRRRLRCVGCRRAMSYRGRVYACGSLTTGGDACPAPARVLGTTIDGYVAGVWLHAVGSLDPDDPLAHVIAARWAAHERPEQTEEYEEAKTAHKAANAALARLESDRKAGYYDGPAEALYGPARLEAVADLTAALDRIDALMTPVVRPGFLSDEELLREVWESADMALRADLIGLAIDRIDVSKAAYQGQHFNGADRVTITWATPEENAA